MICLMPTPNEKKKFKIIGVSSTFDYAIWGVLENKTNATPHPNFGWLMTAIEEE